MKNCKKFAKIIFKNSEKSPKIIFNSIPNFPDFSNESPINDDFFKKKLTRSDKYQRKWQKANSLKIETF